MRESRTGSSAPIALYGISRTRIPSGVLVGLARVVASRVRLHRLWLSVHGPGRSGPGGRVHGRLGRRRGRSRARPGLPPVAAHRPGGRRMERAS